MSVWVIFALGGLGTYLIRASFLSVAERAIDLPPNLEAMLRMIPPAALGALTALAVAHPPGDAAPWPRVIAAVAAGATAWRAKSVFATLSVGLLLLMVIEATL